MHDVPVPSPTAAHLRAAWQTQLTAAKQRPGLLPLLMRQRHDLLPRFSAAYRALHALPRRMRRYLQRHWRQSLAGLALGMVLGQGLAVADTITVDGTTCTLINAIVTANTDVNTLGCMQTPSATAGADTLVLQPSSVHTLTAADNSTYGPTGLPVISGEITIEGQGSTIQREGIANFRILAVNSTGTLTLKDTTISGGIASGPLPDHAGGGILNYGGTVTLEGCTLSDNTAVIGGGVDSRPLPNGTSMVTITNSLLSGNSASVYGGACTTGLALTGRVQ